MIDSTLLDFLAKQPSVEIHISETGFAQGGRMRVFVNGDEVAESDDLRKALLSAIERRRLHPQ